MSIVTHSRSYLVAWTARLPLMPDALHQRSPDGMSPRG